MRRWGTRWALWGIVLCATGLAVAVAWAQTATPPAPARAKKAAPPGETGEEALYLRSLSERKVQVTVKLHDGESVQGWIEYFDDRMKNPEEIETQLGLTNLGLVPQVQTVNAGPASRLSFTTPLRTFTAALFVPAPSSQKTIKGSTRHGRLQPRPAQSRTVLSQSSGRNSRDKRGELEAPEGSP